MKGFHPRLVLKELSTGTAMRWPSFSYGALPVTIVILALISCLVAYSVTAANVENSRVRSISRTLQQNGLRIDSVFNSYAHVLWGSTGYLQAHGGDDASWESFMKVYDIESNFTGVEAIGLMQGDTPTNQVLAYVTPQTPATQQQVGIDMGSQLPLVPTLNEAAKTGDATVSESLPGLFSTKKGVKPTFNGFLMTMPYYDTSLPTGTVSERLAALRGNTAAMFRGDIFFGTIFQDVDLSHTRVEVYLGDVKPANLMYKGGATTDSDVRTVKQQIKEYGKTFTLVYTFDTANILSWSLNYFPQFIMVGGLLLGLMFAAAAGYMLRTRYQHMSIEKERDVKFAQDELLSLASHQLRTPATGVKQYLGMVLQGFAGDLTEKQRTYLERAYASNNRQLGVINDILHLAKLETGRIVLSERKFDIAKMVRDVVDEQREVAEKGGITMQSSAPSTGMIVGDSHMLRMVIENLVSNAIKYTNEGGSVTVRLARRGNRWVLVVKDTGVGISKSDFPKLFKQFSRINNARSEQVTGTGVGLYLAYHLTVLHGGSIGVTSVKGKGSTFTVRLPRKL
jgi:signal transduction histidine kinase